MTKERSVCPTNLDFLIHWPNRVRLHWPFGVIPNIFLQNQTPSLIMTSEHENF